MEAHDAVTAMFAEALVEVQKAKKRSPHISHEDAVSEVVSIYLTKGKARGWLSGHLRKYLIVNGSNRK
jgi:hypothetical protein